MARAGGCVDVCRRLLGRARDCSSSPTTAARRPVSRREAPSRHARHDRAPAAGERLRPRDLRPDDGVRAEGVGADPPRPAQSLDHEGRRLPDARERADHPLRDLLHAHEDRAKARPARDRRRDGLRDRADADRRAGASVQGDRTLVPVRRDPDALHLRRQLPRLHPAAADRRDLARCPSLGHLCGDQLDLGHARARAAHLLLHALRRHPLERPGAVLQELDPGGAEAAPRR